MLNFPTLPQVIQKPIELGADFVIQSTTKFYDGHNMTVGGAVVAATDELHELIKHMQNVHGNIMSPQAQMRSPAYLPRTSRGDCICDSVHLIRVSIFCFLTFELCSGAECVLYAPDVQDDGASYREAERQRAGESSS